MNAHWSRLYMLRRWAKFNGVGVLGFCVQISTIFILIRAFNIGPLVATVSAVEVAVLHNFAWHHFYTWKDRRPRIRSTFLLRLLVFNGTNGMVSLTGNLFFAWVIVKRGHISLLVANLLAISVCSLINFVLSDTIVFRGAVIDSNSRRMTATVHRTFRLVVPVLFCVVAGGATVHAQDAASPKFTLFAGPGIFAMHGSAREEIQVGGSFDEAPPGAGGGYLFEGGYLAPWSQPRLGSAFLSADYMVAWNFGPKGGGRTATGSPYWSDKGWKLLPFAVAGYTRVFGTGNAVNFGGGVDYRFSNTRALRMEIRDYYSFSTPRQHNVALQIGLVIYISD